MTKHIGCYSTVDYHGNGYAKMAKNYPTGGYCKLELSEGEYQEGDIQELLTKKGS